MMFSNKNQNEDSKPKDNFTALKSFLMNFYNSQREYWDRPNQSNNNIFSICSHNHFHSVHQKKTWDLAKTLRTKGESRTLFEEWNSIKNNSRNHECKIKNLNELRIDSKNVIRANTDKGIY